MRCTIDPRLIRSVLHQRPERHDISPLPDIKRRNTETPFLKCHPNGFFHIIIAEVHLSK